jgi:hypothetical protein
MLLPCVFMTWSLFGHTLVTETVMLDWHPCLALADCFALRARKCMLQKAVSRDVSALIAKRRLFYVRLDRIASLGLCRLQVPALSLCLFSLTPSSLVEGRMARDDWFLWHA